MIAILVPSKSRQEQFKRMHDSVGDKANIYAALSCEDMIRYRANGAKFCFLKTHDYLPTVQKWNMLAKIAMDNPKNKLFMLGADDMYFATDGWDKALIDHYNALDNKIHVYHLQDSRDINGTPHPIFTREWIEFWGYMINPVFLHWQCDTWAVELAKYAGCFTHIRDHQLTHDKPSDYGQADSTHTGIRSFGWAERDQFVWGACRDYLDHDKTKLLKEMS